MAKALGTLKNWREITLKNSRLEISAALKINLKRISLETYLPDLIFLVGSVKAQPGYITKEEELHGLLARMEPPRGNASAVDMLPRLTQIYTYMCLILTANDLSPPTFEVLTAVTVNYVYLHVVYVTTLSVVQTICGRMRQWPNLR
jgi:hypothetical protein